MRTTPRESLLTLTKMKQTQRSYAQELKSTKWSRRSELKLLQIRILQLLSA